MSPLVTCLLHHVSLACPTLPVTFHCCEMDPQSWNGVKQRRSHTHILIVHLPPATVSGCYFSEWSIVCLGLSERSQHKAPSPAFKTRLDYQWIVLFLQLWRVLSDFSFMWHNGPHRQAAWVQRFYRMPWEQYMKSQWQMTITHKIR